MITATVPGTTTATLTGIQAVTYGLGSTPITAHMALEIPRATDTTALTPIDTVKNPGPIPGPAGGTKTTTPAGSTGGINLIDPIPRTDPSPTTPGIRTDIPTRGNPGPPPWEGRIAFFPHTPPLRSTWIISTDLEPPTKLPTPVLMTGHLLGHLPAVVEDL